MGPAMRATMLDRLVGYIAPTAGLQRIRARKQADALMNYDAASRGRRTASWNSPASSADAASAEWGARARLRNVTRDFIRNRPYAQRGISVICGNVVGTGIVPSIHAEQESLRHDVEAAVLGHLLSTDLDSTGVLDIAAAQRVALNAVIEDGEVLVRRRWRVGPYARGLRLPFQIELLEADYLNPWITSHGRNEVIDGLEIGPTGAVTAYHLFRQHPGTASRRIDLESVRVPAVDMLHIRRIDRPGQLRGVSWFAPVLLTLGDLADYQEGEILKQKIAALLAGFVESDEADVGAAVSTEVAADDLGLGEIAPATLTELPPGKKVTFTDPPRTDGYAPFMRQTLAAVAMGLGITYESLAGDLGSVNFSSARMGRMEMDRNIETWQSQVMIGQLCTGLTRWSTEAWALTRTGGALMPAAPAAPAPFSITWTAPRRPVIDPTREIPAFIKEIDAGITSRRRVQRQLGLDPTAIARERREDAVIDTTFTAAAPGVGA